MSIPASLRKEIEDATQLIDTGEESYLSLSKKFNNVEVRAYMPYTMRDLRGKS